MDMLKQLGKAAAWLLAVSHVIGEILGFLIIPALVVVCGLLNGYPGEYYLYTLGVYVLLYLAVRLGVHWFGKWFERKFEKKS